MGGWMCTRGWVLPRKTVASRFGKHGGQGYDRVQGTATDYLQRHYLIHKQHCNDSTTTTRNNKDHDPPLFFVIEFNRLPSLTVGHALVVEHVAYHDAITPRKHREWSWRTTSFYTPRVPLCRGLRPDSGTGIAGVAAVRCGGPGNIVGDGGVKCRKRKVTRHGK